MKQEIVHEQKSPLFRIMSIYNIDEPSKRAFGNNICAFHIGNGYILSVAHNLRLTAGAPGSLSESEYQDLLLKLNQAQKTTFNSFYTLDSQTNKRNINVGINETQIKQLATILDSINHDTRWLTYYQKNICKPFLVIQFHENLFYQDKEATDKINPLHRFHEPAILRHTFLLELKLIEAFYSDDFALYRIVEDKSVIDKIPFLEIDYSIYDESHNDYFCLQSAPGAEIGRLLNKVNLEGILDTWAHFPDKVGGNYITEGLRYIVKGYFRFGSSGAPYLKYDKKSKSFKINAIQSEGAPIQMQINKSLDGNFQYVNAIASPLQNIEAKLKAHTEVGINQSGQKSEVTKKVSLFISNLYKFFARSK
ncbi:MAG: hypothetical protein Q8P83_02470 [bacterium]|nr:hypothetical protein [bacterium]